MAGLTDPTYPIRTDVAQLPGEADRASGAGAVGITRPHRFRTALVVLAGATYPGSPAMAGQPSTTYTRHVPGRPLRGRWGKPRRGPLGDSVRGTAKRRRPRPEQRGPGIGPSELP